MIRRVLTKYGLYYDPETALEAPASKERTEQAKLPENLKQTASGTVVKENPVTHEWELVKNAGEAKKATKAAGRSPILTDEEITEMANTKPRLDAAIGALIKTHWAEGLGAARIEKKGVGVKMRTIEKYVRIFNRKNTALRS